MQTFTVVLLVSLFTMAVGPTVGFAASTDSIAMSCVAGATGSIRVSVEPIRMREESDKHFIDFSIESRLAAATKSRVVHYVAFSRADGSQFQPPVESMVVALTDTRPGHTHSLTAALPSVDGTYLVRVFTASVSEGDQQSLITDLPVSVSGGQVYIGHDQVGLAQRQAEQVGKPPVTNACPINNPDCGPGGILTRLTRRLPPAITPAPSLVGFYFGTARETSVPVGAFVPVPNIWQAHLIRRCQCEARACPSAKALRHTAMVSPMITAISRSVTHGRKRYPAAVKELKHRP